MSNPNQARRVSAQIFFQGVDITGSMRPYLLSATYTDREEDGTDDLQLKLQDRDDVWLKKWLTDVIDAAASAGSLSASAKSEAASTAKSYKVTAKSGLNVRSGPGTDYAVIGGLSNGTWVVVLSQQNGWYQVLYRNSSDQAAIGYVSADYLTLTQR